MGFKYLIAHNNIVQNRIVSSLDIKCWQLKNAKRENSFQLQVEMNCPYVLSFAISGHRRKTIVSLAKFDML